MLRVGLDVHGVLDTYKRLFNTLLPLVRKTGDVEIHLVTGPSLIDAMEEVKALGYKKGIHYDFLHSIVEYLDVRGINKWQDENGNWWAADEDWWSSKAKICKYYKIDTMIDDSKKYEPYFNDKTKFVHLDQLKRRVASKRNIINEI